LRDVRLAPTAGRDALYKKAARALGVQQGEISSLRIQRRGLDARKKQDIHYNYTLLITLRSGEEKAASRCKTAEIYEEKVYSLPQGDFSAAPRPVIVGFGPAGMFAALALAEAGLRPIVLERGADVDTRKKLVDEFWRTGKLDPECNVQFGEGGAGTFSDGKLNTGTNDERISWVLARLHEFGAPEQITYDSRPHVGTDVLINVVRALRERVVSLGGEMRFSSRLVGLETSGGALCAVRVADGNGEYSLPCESAILALGHSARDTFEMLHDAGIPMEPKGFSMGVRIEHRQSMVDVSQYGAEHGALSLPAAEYRLNCKLPDGNSAYTFCMCPGGYVVAAASEPGRVVTNGMSYSGRDGENANSALLVTLRPEDFPYPGALGGMRWQREVESAAYNAAGGYKAPAETVGSFLGTGSAESAVVPTYKPGVAWVSLREVLPEKVSSVLAEAIPALGKKLRGFDDPGAVMTAPETRSSSPVRITRGSDRMSTGLSGLYPCGEGAGYAGGIVSAAVDGLRCAEALLEKLK
jgi:hypothetical protein